MDKQARLNIVKHSAYRDLVLPGLATVGILGVIASAVHKKREKREAIKLINQGVAEMKTPNYILVRKRLDKQARQNITEKRDLIAPLVGLGTFGALVGSQIKLTKEPVYIKYKTSPRVHPGLPTIPGQIVNDQVIQMKLKPRIISRLMPSQKWKLAMNPNSFKAYNKIKLTSAGKRNLFGAGLSALIAMILTSGVVEATKGNNRKK